MGLLSQVERNLGAGGGPEIIRIGLFPLPAIGEDDPQTLLGAGLLEEGAHRRRGWNFWLLNEHWRLGAHHLRRRNGDTRGETSVEWEHPPLFSQRSLRHR